ncbi:MAG: AAA family ATPase [Myxococcaceae bacterium]|nr:AAA family ATPase [Myxococcaceae bacterium]
MPQPNIYEEIVAWSKDRPEWQRDALRRLAETGTLTSADLDELAQLCLAAHGVESVEVRPVPISTDHLPQQGQAVGAVGLTKLSAVKNVAALLPDQNLRFLPKGLSIVYGDNGSGKSSYARILKRVCRARGASEGVRPNVFAAASAASEATIDFEVGGQVQLVTWKDDGATAAPSQLSHISVFDQAAASAYVSAKQDTSVRPAGLDLLTGLYGAVEAVRSRIQGRLTAAKTAARPVEGVDPSTKTGAFIAGLTAKTTTDEIEQALAFSDADLSRGQALAKDVARLDAEDPQRMAKELRGRRARIEGLRQRVEVIRSVLAPAAIEGLGKLLEASALKEQAATLASSLSFEGALPGVGGEVWRELWEAARRYSTRAAYPQQPFPVVGPDAKCVLCQQPLAEEARQRVAKFEEFVRNTAAAEARAARAAFDSAKRRVAELVTTADDAVLIQELDEVQPQLGTMVQRALDAAGDLRKAVLDAIAAAKPLPVADVVGQLPEQLQALTAELERRAQEALAAHDPTKKVALQKELAELRARAVAAKRKGDVLAFVGSARTVAALERCLADAATNAITAKNTELTKKAVTDSLRTFFDDERRGLGLDRTPVELGPAGGSKAVLYHQLALRGARGAAPTDVLSEGEQRVCALASFFAEMLLAPTKSAIIFDDPVSSFDHLRRENVARRLAREAADRQVIVFTHDAVFLLALIEAAEAFAASLLVQQVQTAGASVGHCSEGPPWVGMAVNKRIGFLKSEWVKADKFFRNNERTTYNGLARQLYGLLRETWERAIEEVLFGGVIERLKLSVETNKLKLVDIAPTDFERVERGMSKASAQLIGHDQPAAVNTPAPQPDELDADIKELESWVKDVRARREKKKSATPVIAEVVPLPVKGANG